MSKEILTTNIKIITLLSGYVRELGEGEDYEETTFKLADGLEKMVANKTIGDVGKFLEKEFKGDPKYIRDLIKYRVIDKLKKLKL